MDTLAFRDGCVSTSTASEGIVATLNRSSFFSSPDFSDLIGEIASMGVNFGGIAESSHP